MDFRLSDLATDLGRVLDIEVPGDLITEVDDIMQPVLTEWSINGDASVRGRLRYGSWTNDPTACERALDHLGAGGIQAMRSAICGRGSEAIGFGLAPRTKQRLRWWRLVEGEEGRAMAEDVVAYEPLLDSDYELMARATGHPDWCSAVGCASIDGQVSRTTLYFELPTPESVVPILEHIGCPPSLRANQFFRGLLGLDKGRRRPWPKVWVGRSVGAGGGWKFYYFARKEPTRVSDELLIRLSGETNRTPYNCYRRVACGDDTRTPVIQIVGLSILDGRVAQAPHWTLYLADDEVKSAKTETQLSPGAEAATLGQPLAIETEHRP